MSLKIDRLQLEIIIDNDQSRKELRELEGDMKKLKKEMRKVPEGSKEWDQMNNRLKEMKLRHDAVIDAIGINGLSLKELAQRQRELNLMMRNMDPRTAEYKKLAQQSKEVSGRIDELRVGMRKTQFSISGLADGFNKYFGIVTAGIASLTGVILSFKKLLTGSAELSDALSDVRKTTGLTQVEVVELNKALKGIDTRSSRKELLDLARIAGKLGVTGKEDILGFVRAADQINVALSEDLGGNAEEAIRQVGKLVDIFKVKDQVGIEQGMLKVGSAINALGASSTANEAYLIEFTKRLGGVAAQAGISIENVLGLGATLDQLGQTSEVSSTALSKLITDMFKDTAQYADVAGVSVDEFTELLRTDTNSAFIKLLEGLNGNNAGLSEMALKLNDLGLDGSRAIGVLATLSNNTEMLRDQQKLSNDEFTKGTSLTEEFSVKNENLAATMAKINKQLSGLFINSGMMSFVQNLTKGFGRLVNNIDSFFNKEETYAEKIHNVNRELSNRIEVLKRADFTEQQRKQYLTDINEEYKDYLPRLITEKDTIQSLTVLQADLNKLLMERVIYAAYEEEIKDLMQMQLAATKLQYEAEKELQENRMNPNLVGYQAEMLEEQLEGLKTLGQQMVEDQDGNITALESKYEAMAESMGLIFADIKKNMAGLFTDSGNQDGALDGDGTVDTTIRQKAIEDYYAAINKLADENFQKSLSLDEQELLAIDRKYEALYEKAVAAGESTDELQVMHAQELADKILEIEDETQKELAIKKEEAIRKQMNDEQRKKDYIIAMNQQLINAENELKDARMNAARSVTDAMLGIVSQTHALGKAFFVLSKALAIAQVIKDAAASKAAIMRNLFTIPPFLPPGIPNPMFAAAAATAAAQLSASKINTATSIAQIVATSIPEVVQWAAGKYDVIGASDGRTYRAGYDSQASTGIYSRPTLVGGLGLVAERAPELVVDGPTLRNIQMNYPEIINAIQAARVPQYAEGNYPATVSTSQPQPQPQAQQSPEMAAMLQRLAEISQKLDNPTRAVVVYNDIKDADNEMNDIYNSVSK